MSWTHGCSESELWHYSSIVLPLHYQYAEWNDEQANMHVGMQLQFTSDNAEKQQKHKEIVLSKKIPYKVL